MRSDKRRPKLLRKEDEELKSFEELNINDVKSFAKSEFIGGHKSSQLTEQMHLKLIVGIIARIIIMICPTSRRNS